MSTCMHVLSGRETEIEEREREEDRGRGGEGGVGSLGGGVSLPAQALSRQ